MQDHLPDQGGPLLGRTVADLLDALAAATPAPGGGGAAALATALSAALVAMAGRYAAQAGADPEIAALVARADSLRRAAAPLADQDAQAYRDFLAATRLPRHGDPDRRAAQIAAARGRAAAVPLRIAEIGAEVAALAAVVAGRGRPMLRGDAVTAALLAGAAARAAAVLVAENLPGSPDDPRLARARALADAAAHAAGTATGQP